MASLASLPRVSSTLTVGTMNTLWVAANAPSVVGVPSNPVSGVVAPTVTSRMMTLLRYAGSLCMGVRYSRLTRSQ